MPTGAVVGPACDVGGVARQGGLAMLVFLFGIARSWQLVGPRNISLASTVTAVIQHPATLGKPFATDDEEGEGRYSG